MKYNKIQDGGLAAVCVLCVPSSFLVYYNSLRITPLKRTEIIQTERF